MHGRPPRVYRGDFMREYQARAGGYLPPEPDLDNIQKMTNIINSSRDMDEVTEEERKQYEKKLNILTAAAVITLAVFGLWFLAAVAIISNEVFKEMNRKANPTMRELFVPEIKNELQKQNQQYQQQQPQQQPQQEPEPEPEQQPQQQPQQEPEPGQQFGGDQYEYPVWSESQLKIANEEAPQYQQTELPDEDQEVKVSDLEKKRNNIDKGLSEIEENKKLIKQNKKETKEFEKQQQQNERKLQQDKKELDKITKKEQEIIKEQQSLNLKHEQQQLKLGQEQSKDRLEIDKKIQNLKKKKDSLFPNTDKLAQKQQQEKQQIVDPKDKKSIQSAQKKVNQDNAQKEKEKKINIKAGKPPQAPVILSSGAPKVVGASKG